jgi:hypothetical protein
MYHGLLVGDRHLPTRMPTPAADAESSRHEIPMSVACGSGLGELYVTPKLMTAAAWDALAEGIRWSRGHRTILRATHWVGGDPKQDVYGYAAWDPQQGGPAVLRNPTAGPRSFALDPQSLFELPTAALIHPSIRARAALAARAWFTAPCLATRWLVPARLACSLMTCLPGSRGRWLVADSLY